METERLLERTDCEGAGFWKKHFGWKRVELLFPTIVDYVREEVRNRDAALFSLLSILLLFFYGSVLNTPGTVVLCTEGSEQTPWVASSLLFHWIYVSLWIAEMMGNAERYSTWLYHCGGLWVGWGCGCLTYAFSHCSVSLNMYGENVLADIVFVLLLSVHYLAAYHWSLYYLPERCRRWVSPLCWLSALVQRIHPAPRYRTPLQLQVAMLLALWALLGLFLQSLHQILVFFEFIRALEQELPEVAQYVWALPYACALGCGLSFCLGLFSVFSLYYNYRKTLVEIITEGSNSPALHCYWQVSAHESLFFPCTPHPVQFMAHVIYFYALLCYLLITLFFALLSTWFYRLIYVFIKEHPLWLPFFIVPTAIKLLYLPRLAYRPTGEIRNKAYFAFWDFVQATLGIGQGLVRGLIRYLMGFGLMLAFFYRSHRSVYSVKLQGYDALYTGFCGLVVLHCLRLGIEPNPDTSSTQAEMTTSQPLSSNPSVQAE